jgi:uncharacterized protein YceH (UPF0502 family)
VIEGRIAERPLVKKGEGQTEDGDVVEMIADLADDLAEPGIAVVPVFPEDLNEHVPTPACIIDGTGPSGLTNSGPGSDGSGSKSGFGEPRIHSILSRACALRERSIRAGGIACEGVERVKRLTELDPHARRVLGVLLEKEQTTPEYYPLTLNALITACNQTTNREPVMSLKRHEVLRALHTLGRLGLVQRVTGARVDRWSHLLIQALVSRPPTKALLTVLLLRGAQTVGELKARTDRMHTFGSLEEVEAALRLFVESDPPLARELERRPGQKESRWELNSSGEDVTIEEDEAGDEPELETVAGNLSLRERVERLEEQVREILRRLEAPGDE